MKTDTAGSSPMTTPEPAPVDAEVEAPFERKARLAASMNVDGAYPIHVLHAVAGCAMCWTPDARLVGNVRAGDIVRAIQSLTASQTDAAREKAAALWIIEGHARVIKRLEDENAALRAENAALKVRLGEKASPDGPVPARSPPG